MPPVVDKKAAKAAPAQAKPTKPKAAEKPAPAPKKPEAAPAKKEGETKKKMKYRRVKVGKHPAVRAYMNLEKIQTKKVRSKRIKKELAMLRKLKRKKSIKTVKVRRQLRQKERRMITVDKENLLRVMMRVKGYKKLLQRRRGIRVKTRANTRPKIVTKQGDKFVMKTKDGRTLIANPKYVKEKKGTFYYNNKKLDKLDAKVSKTGILRKARKLVGLRFARSLANMKPKKNHSKAVKILCRNKFLARFFIRHARKKGLSLKKIANANMNHKIKIDKKLPSGFSTQRIHRVRYGTEKIAKRWKRTSKQRKPALKVGYTPGKVLIVLKGHHRGKHVVFLKQLASGKLLCTGPYYYNRVPLRRFNQAFTIATSTKIDLSGLKISEKLNDKLLDVNRTKKKAAKPNFFGKQIFKKKRSKQLVKRSPKLKRYQKEIDKYIVKKVEQMKPRSEARIMKSYLRSYFTIKRNVHPHKLRF